MLVVGVFGLAAAVFAGGVALATYWVQTRTITPDPYTNEVSSPDRTAIASTIASNGQTQGSETPKPAQSQPASLEPIVASNTQVPISKPREPEHVQTPPTNAIAFKSTSLPDISVFTAFTKRMATQMELSHKDRAGQDTPRPGDFDEYGVTVVDCDYKKTDSLLHPVVAVAAFRTTSFAGNKDLLVHLWTENTYTIQFAVEDGKWVPVKGSVVLTKYESMPKSRYTADPPTGQEEQINVRWFAGLAEELQRRP